MSLRLRCEVEVRPPTCGATRKRLFTIAGLLPTCVVEAVGVTGGRVWVCRPTLPAGQLCIAFCVPLINGFTFIF